MKSKMNLKSIGFMAIIGIISLFFINMSFAANTAKIIVETANLRDTADTSSKILVQISQGEEVEILEESGEWYKIKYNNITGYLREDLIDVEKEAVENNNTTETSTTVEENVTEEPNQEETTTPAAEISEGKNYIKQDTKLKIVPVINATDIIEAKQGEEVEVIEIINGWACVQNSTTKGWIRTEKLQTEEEKKQEEEAQRKQEEEIKKQQEEEKKKQEEAKQKEQQVKTTTKYINANTVNLRKEASKSSEIITSLVLNTEVKVTSEKGGWAKVKVNGKEGYIASSLLSNNKQETSRSSTTRTPEATQTSKKEETTTNESTTAPVSGNGSAVVEYAKQFIGTKYVYGGSSPSTGFDCSGFTAYVYKKFGVNLPHSSGAQGKLGTAVSKDNLAPGDLVFYSGHVAIYVGGGQVIHAPRPGKSVCIVPLNQASTSGFLGARRVL